MRRLRGAYMENVRAGKCKFDAKVLAEFDRTLEHATHGTKSIPAKH